MLLPQIAPPVVVEVVEVVTVTVVEVLAGAVVVVAPGPQASQQLEVAPTDAEPPGGATQRSALRFTLHLLLPFAKVRQQVTASSFPHVERIAQRTTLLRQDGLMVPSLTAAFATPATQLT